MSINRRWTLRLFPYFYYLLCTVFQYTWELRLLWWHDDFISFKYIPRSVAVGSYGKWTFNFCGTFILCYCFLNGCTSLHLPHIMQWLPFSYASWTTLAIFLLKTVILMACGDIWLCFWFVFLSWIEALLVRKFSNTRFN